MTALRSSDIRAWACQCEDERHPSACSSTERELDARALHVGEVCDPCARGCLRDYVTKIGSHSLEEQTVTTYCHQGVDGPTCRGHAPQLVSRVVPVLVTDVDEVVADFHGNRAWDNVRAMMFALYEGEAADFEATRDTKAMQNLRLLASSEDVAMELWWQATGDDWPVPPTLPARFVDEVLTRILSRSGDVTNLVANERPDTRTQ